MRVVQLLLVGLLFLSPVLAAQPDANLGSVVRISGFDQKAEPVTGTGFLVKAESGNSRRAWLVTAAHLLQQISGEKIELLLRRGQGRNLRGFSQAYQLRDGGRNLFFKSQSFDLAAFLIELPADCSCSLLALEMLADEKDFAGFAAEVGSLLLIYGYPYGQSFEATGNCIVRSGIISSAPIFPSDAYPFFLGDFEVFAGYSGAPVFLRRNDSLILAGMVLEEVFLEELRSRGSKTRRTRRGLGLAKILNSVHLKKFVAELEKR